ncbi:hypothetical protein Tco_0073458, partial [Tanacetum coccineum]
MNPEGATDQYGTVEDWSEASVLVPLFSLLIERGVIVFLGQLMPRWWYRGGLIRSSPADWRFLMGLQFRVVERVAWPGPFIFLTNFGVRVRWASMSSGDWVCGLYWASVNLGVCRGLSCVNVWWTGIGLSGRFVLRWSWVLCGAGVLLPVSGVVLL